MPDSQDDKLKAYEQLCISYRAIDDFRAKLLGFLPLATGTGAFLLLDNLTGGYEGYLGAIGVFGFVITLALFAYEIYGIKKCHALITAGQQLEDSLHLDGQFVRRPQNVAYLINEPFAAAVIYPTVLAAWVFLAVYSRWSQEAAWVAAIVVFVVFFFGTMFYELRLRNDIKEEILDDIKVLYVESTNGPEGSPEAFKELKSRLPSWKGRKVYGIQYPDSLYRACVAIKDTDDLKIRGLDTSIIPRGKYARRKLKIPNSYWEKRTRDIPETFTALSKEYQGNVDSSRPSIEFYKSQKKLLLYLPIM